jgi:hypothetical protein
LYAGLEKQQGEFLAEVLADPACGTHLCHAMLLPLSASQGLLRQYQEKGEVDLGGAHVRREGKASVVTMRNPRHLNAEDEVTLGPLETAIERVGKSPVTAHRVNFANPMVGDRKAAAASHSMELFAPADFLTLTDDQRLSRPGFESFPAGARFAAATGPDFGPASDTLYEWVTIFPHEPALPARRYGQKFNAVEAAVLRAGPVARAARARGNPYLPTLDPVQFTAPGQVQVRQRDDLGVVNAAEGFMTTTEASHAVKLLVDAGADATSFELVTVGVLR